MSISQVDPRHEANDVKTAMFFPKDNPGYYSLSDEAKKLIIKWSKNEWYESSTAGEEIKEFDGAGDAEGQIERQRIEL